SCSRPCHGGIETRFSHAEHSDPSSLWRQSCSRAADHHIHCSPREARKQHATELDLIAERQGLLTLTISWCTLQPPHLDPCFEAGAGWCYPLTEPAVRPATMRPWKMSTRAMSGTVTRT